MQPTEAPHSVTGAAGLTRVLDSHYFPTLTIIVPGAITLNIITSDFIMAKV